MCRKGIIIIIDNFCIALFSGVPKLTHKIRDRENFGDDDDDDDGGGGGGGDDDDDGGGGGGGGDGDDDDDDADLCGRLPPVSMMKIYSAGLWTRGLRSTVLRAWLSSQLSVV